MSDIYVSVVDFKTNTGITLDDNLIEEALINASQTIRTAVFYKKVYNISHPTTQIKIDTPVADYSLDGTVTVDDFLIYELDDKNYVTPETDLKAKVTSFVPKYGFITLSDPYPTSTRRLIVEAYVARFDNEIMIPYLKRLNILLACDYLFTNVPISTLQNGISSWTLNGVSVAFDMNSFKSIKESVIKESSKLIKFIAPAISFRTALGFGNDDYTRRGGRFIISSSSGNRHIIR